MFSIFLKRCADQPRRAGVLCETISQSISYAGSPECPAGRNHADVSGLLARLSRFEFANGVADTFRACERSRDSFCHGATWIVA
jgi:hypothetical protein